MSPETRLSPRELDILRLIRDDHGNDAIAHELGISQQTVKNHLTSAYMKLGVASRSAAVTVAIQRGLISLFPEDVPVPAAPIVVEALAEHRSALDDALTEIRSMRATVDAMEADLESRRDWIVLTLGRMRIGRSH